MTEANEVRKTISKVAYTIAVDDFNRENEITRERGGVRMKMIARSSSKFEGGSERWCCSLRS